MTVSAHNLKKQEYLKEYLIEIDDVEVNIPAGRIKFIYKPPSLPVR